MDRDPWHGSSKEREEDEEDDVEPLEHPSSSSSSSSSTPPSSLSSSSSSTSSSSSSTRLAVEEEAEGAEGAEGAAGLGESRAAGGAGGGTVGEEAAAAPAAFPCSSVTCPWVPPSLSSREMQDALHRWNLDELLRLCRVSFGARFEAGPAGDGAPFWVDLLNAPEVRAAWSPVSRGKGAAPLRGRVESVRARPLRVSQTSMSFFDKFEAEGIVDKESGYVRKCMDAQVEGATLQDLLRDTLANPDGEYAYLYDDEERSELLFELLRLLAVGGSMCQWEDYWTPYVEATKGLYKDLVRVRKNPHTGALEVTSLAFALEALTSTDPADKLFPLRNAHNRCLVVLDPAARTLVLLYAPFVPFW